MNNISTLDPYINNNTFIFTCKQIDILYSSNIPLSSINLSFDLDNNLIILRLKTNLEKIISTRYLILYIEELTK